MLWAATQGKLVATVADRDVQPVFDMVDMLVELAAEITESGNVIWL
jgi:hypothetical protein